MGSKINKKIGFIVIQDEIKDTEFLEDLSLKDLFETSPEEFKSELKHEMSLSDQRNEKLYNFIDIVDCGDNTGKKIYIITPPSVLNEWTRRGCLIDHLEANGSAEVKINYINERVLPHWNSLIVSSTGSELDEIQQGRLLSLNKEYFNRFDKSVVADLETKGIDFNKNLKEQIHMKAPQVVFELAKTIGITDIKDLKLAIVTYWS